MPIRILDSTTIARIAAGEVVERPASVVKELVENALDAAAGRIEIEVRGGGVNFIRVSDNGTGIAASEVELAFTRHATSKIRGAADLDNIVSLGFRGEALPSIAAVADVEMLTCAENETAGTLVVLSDGKLVRRAAQARPRGTTVVVRNLFQRVPARLKFLKSPATENAHIANVVSQYALAYPETAFSLVVDGRESLHTTGSGSLLDAIASVYGLDVAGKMLPVAVENGWQRSPSPQVKVAGMVSAPEVARAGRGVLSFFVNRRWVASRLLSYAVEEAYRGLILSGRYPVVVLNIMLPPTEVDVNIHPAKSEVKFRHESEIFRVVHHAVRQSLLAKMPVPELKEPTAIYEVKESVSPRMEMVSPEGTVRRDDVSPAPVPAGVPVLRVLGQAMGCYIVAEGPDGIYLIDQHAAHERVRYEALKRQHASRKPEVQGLLVPAVFEVAPRQEAVMKSCLPELSAFGFVLEIFGERAYLVRAVPALLGGDDWQSALRETIDGLITEESSRWREKMTVSLACHGAVRRGHILTDDEMRALVRQLEGAENPHTCPHGRPTMIRLGTAHLEREFGRSG
ncbi:MAG: DNA mismatch repair endonuclease MutL [Dehalococcoidales bacterium]|nr:DNA mismatch repair endonuclease MutL [Dehalococcoidales bacterium]